MQGRLASTHLYPRDPSSFAHQLQYTSSGTLLPDQNQTLRVKLRFLQETAAAEGFAACYTMWATYVPGRTDPCIQIPAGPKLFGARMEQDLGPPRSGDQPERACVSGCRAVETSRSRGHVSAMDGYRVEVDARRWRSAACWNYVLENGDPTIDTRFGWYLH